MLLRRRTARQADQQSDDQQHGKQWLARKGGAHDQEFAHEDAERRQAGDGDDAEHETPAEHRMRLGEARPYRQSSACP